jgi:calcineurin-like phosphoesterase family protein
MAPQIVTANRLRDGDVVYLTPTNDWSETLGDAAIARSKEEANTLLATAEIAVNDLKVVGPYEFDVTVENNETKPISMREIIRATGPSMRTDLGKQAVKR